MLKTAEELQKANARFTTLVAAVVTAFAFSKEQETKIKAEDFSPIAVGVEELQKPATAYRSVLVASLKLTDEQLTSADAGDTITDAISAKDTKISELTARAELAEGKVTKLELEKKSADELADSKSREIAARAGANLPPKAQGAGNKTIPDAEITGKTPRERLAAHFNAQFPVKAAA